jgi:shikimate dehydrogenase
MINGETKLVGLVGYPVAHSLSPVMFNAVFKSRQMNWCYVPLPVKSSEDLKAVISALKKVGFIGFNVTMPYKEAVIDCLDEVTAFAKLAGAVNVVHLQDGQTIGYNTDGRGFIRSLEEMGYQLADKEVLVLGAGGAAKSVVLSLALEGVKNFTLANRTLEHAEIVASRLLEKFPQVQVEVFSLAEELAFYLEKADLIINATPVGMKNEELPLKESDLKVINSRHLVYDLIYWPDETPLLKLAKLKGARVVNGLPMLVGQAAASFEIWTGLEAPVQTMQVAAEKFLEERHGQAEKAIG